VASLLVLGGVGALLVAARLVAALAGWGLPTPAAVTAAEGGILAACGLLILILVIAALLSSLPVQRQSALRLSGDHGGVVVPLAALRSLVEGAALRHPDVVRAEARLREHDGAPVGSVKLFARPFVDAARLRDDVQARAGAELGRVLGREAAVVKVHATVLRVDQLKRYLP
jgi:hypothetical protein